MDLDIDPARFRFVTVSAYVRDVYYGGSVFSSNISMIRIAGGSRSGHSTPRRRCSATVGATCRHMTGCGSLPRSTASRQRPAETDLFRPAEPAGRGRGQPKPAVPISPMECPLGTPYPDIVPT